MTSRYLTVFVIVNLVDDGYEKWSDYSSCSATCVNGIETRSRKCNNPSPAHGCETCNHLGVDKEEKPCKLRECPCNSSSSLKKLQILVLAIFRFLGKIHLVKKTCSKSAK